VKFSHVLQGARSLVLLLILCGNAAAQSNVETCVPEAKTIGNARFTPGFIVEFYSRPLRDGTSTTAVRTVKGLATYVEVTPGFAPSRVSVQTVSTTNVSYSNGSGSFFVCATPSPLPATIPDPVATEQTYNIGTCSNSDGAYRVTLTAIVNIQTDGAPFSDVITCQRTYNGTPIVIDVLGNGFSLSSYEDGVYFDYPGAGTKERTSWTAHGSDDAFLALDRNGNGQIDNAGELFGNFTLQPSTDKEPRNGFLALGLFDLSENGGNGDQRISKQDKIYDSLLLWQDYNHDGMSQPEEIKSLSDSPIKAISLDYRHSRRVDQFGNWYRFAAPVYDEKGSDIGRRAWDITFKTGP